MTYMVHNFVGCQPIATNSSTQLHPLGQVVQAADPTYGAGEFIYLKGLAGTTVGAIVQYSAAFQTAAFTSAVDKPQPVAIAMSACVANEYGWYQISGQAAVKKAASVSFAAGAQLGAGASIGVGAVAAVSNLVLDGAIVSVVASAKSDVTSVLVMINRPHGIH